MSKLAQVFGSIVSIFFTTEGGVSLSEINRMQAESKQQNDMFWSTVSDAKDGIFTKTISFIGAGDSTPRALSGTTIEIEKINEYTGVAGRNAEISNLMHALKLHKKLQEKLQEMDLKQFVIATLPNAPERPASAKKGTTCGTDAFMELSNIDEMIASLRSDVLAQFDLGFWKKANELNSAAATLGKLLSESGSFFRELIKPLPKGDEKATQNGVIITQWKRSYDDEAFKKLSALRETLQTEYNDLQKQLNGCKKQIKDAVRAYNLESERAYQVAYGIYKVEAEQHNLEMERIRASAETFRQEAMQEIANLKVRTE